MTATDEGMWKQPRIMDGDKILGLNGIPGEDHSAIVHCLENNSDFFFVIGRPLENMGRPPRDPNAKRKHFLPEGTIIEV